VISVEAKILHERKKCIGCGACVALAPEFWRMSSDNKATLLKNKIESKKDFDINKQAEMACPVNCIHVVEEKTKSNPKKAGEKR